MTRRKKAEATTDTATADQPKDTSFNPADFDPEMQQVAQGIVQSVADSTAMPDDQPHAEKVKRKPGYTNQGTTDYVAGVRIHEYQNADTKQYLSIIKFDEKPVREVTALLRQNSFEFDKEKEEWYRPIGYETRQQDRYNADQVFKEACKLVREAKGVTHSFG